MTEKAKTSKPGWRTVKFGDVVRLSKARSQDPMSEGFDRYVGLEHLESGDLRIRRWGNVADGVTFTSVFQPGQVLFGKRRAYQRKVALADFAGVCSGDIYVLESKDPSVLLPELLPFISQTDAFFEHAVGTSAGSLSPRTNWSSLEGFEFVLPPLEYQQRVVQSLSAIEELSESLRDLMNKARDVKQALANKAFPVEEVVSYLEKPGVYFGRNLHPLESAAFLQVGFPFKSAEYSSQGDRLLRGSNVGVNQLLWSSEITCYWPTDRRTEVSEYILKAGDIVIAMDRPFIAEGFKIARVSESDLPALLLQRVGRLQPKDGVNPDYLWTFFHSESFKWQLQRQQKGTDLPHISKFDIEGTLIPRIPLTEQVAVAQQFSEAEAAVTAIQGRSVAAEYQRARVRRSMFG